MLYACVIFAQCLLDRVNTLKSIANIEQTSSKRRANVEQTSSKHRANIKQAWWNPAPWLKCKPRLSPQMITCYISRCIFKVHNVSQWPNLRPSNYNPPALLISMLITIARQVNSMFARSCKRGINHRTHELAAILNQSALQPLLKHAASQWELFDGETPSAETTLCCADVLLTARVQSIQWPWLGRRKISLVATTVTVLSGAHVGPVLRRAEN